MEKISRTCFFILSLQFFFIPGMKAQSNRFTADNGQQFMQDILGKPVYLRVEYNVEGTPFYPAEYFSADIYIRNGKIYTGVPVKFNLLENLLLYKQEDGKEMSATSPISRVVFTDTSKNWTMNNVIFENGFPSIDKQNENTYYEVLDSGKVRLLKCRTVNFTDKKYYGQASMTRVFEQSESYYVYLPERKMKKMEKGVEFFQSVFTDKKEELIRYIEVQKLKCRKESDWKKAIAYYNSLFPNPN